MSDAERSVTLREITDQNRDPVVALRVSAAQDRFVGGVRESIDEAAATAEANPWYRAIYAGEQPVGFVMLSWDVVPRPGIIGPWYLWRLLIDEHHQRHGYGAAALRQVIALIRAAGAQELKTSYVPGDGGPWPFYERLGFVPTGEIEGGEIVISLDLERPSAGLSG
jgi:diamine N-acetyltransferase